MFKIERVEKEYWIREMAKHAHISVFGKDEGANESNLDYALLVTYKDSAVIYSTIKKNGTASITLEYGGSFPDYRSSSLTYPAYVALLEHLRVDHTEICMVIRNDNFPMLKFALKSKFKITGISMNPKGAPLLEHRLTFEKEDENYVG